MRNWRLIFVLLAALSALALVFSGCAGKGVVRTTPQAATQTVKPAATTTATPAPTGPSGQLRVALGTFGEERFYPPSASTTNLWSILGPMYDWMFRLKGQDLTPGIIEKWAMAPDGLSWTYNVQKGVKWHNGDNLTARDVSFTIDRYRAPDALHVYLKQMVDRVEIVDDYTLRIFTKGVQPYLPNMSTLHDPADGAVLPKDYFERVGMEKFQLSPVGSGPFKFVSHAPGDSVIFEAVDKHWRQTPAFKKLSLILMPEEATRIAALKTASVDIVEVGLEGANQVEAAGLKAINLDVMIPWMTIWGSYSPKVAGTPIADVRVRQALSLAINREEIGKTFFRGKYTLPYVAGFPEGAADLDLASWKSYAAKAYRYDPEEAKRLLKEAGYANGFSMKLYTFAMSGAPYLPQLGEIVSGYWAKIGATVQPTPVDYGGVFRGWSLGLTEPKPELLGQASVWRLTNNPVTTKNLTATFSGTTRTMALLGTAKPDLDKLISDAMSEPDTVKRRGMLAKAMQAAADSWVVLPITSVPVTAALGPGVSIDFPQPAISLVFHLELAKHTK
ncbi:MAG: ABC transporter substrate-binding protein [Chloroflexi bacterium]|nr:ABC transporter substrate-binding protein [Chloroflexota bacterium]